MNQIKYKGDRTMKNTARKQPYLFLLTAIFTMALSGFFTPEKSQAFDISVNISLVYLYFVSVNIPHFI